MRSILNQSSADNLRDLILNYNLDRPEYRIIDFTYGKGGLWETDYPYKCQRIFCDAISEDCNVLKKELGKDTYSDLRDIDAGIFDPPYKIGAESVDYTTKQKNGKNVVVSVSNQGKNSWSAEGNLARFTSNITEQNFVDRIKSLEIACKQCMHKDSLLFIKVMNTRFKKRLIDNKQHCIANLPSFVYHAEFIYQKALVPIWRHHNAIAHGYWLVMKMI